MAGDADAPQGPRGTKFRARSTRGKPRPEQTLTRRDQFMPKAEWGTKRVCPTTGKRFYDLNADPIVSPYTGEVVTLDLGKNRALMVADPRTRRPRN
jgi:hypothetical protein